MNSVVFTLELNISLDEFAGFRNLRTLGIHAIRAREEK